MKDFSSKVSTNGYQPGEALDDQTTWVDQEDTDDDDYDYEDDDYEEDDDWEEDDWEEDEDDDWEEEDDDEDDGDEEDDYEEDDYEDDDWEEDEYEALYTRDDEPRKYTLRAPRRYRDEERARYIPSKKQSPRSRQLLDDPMDLDDDERDDF